MYIWVYSRSNKGLWYKCISGCILGVTKDCGISGCILGVTKGCGISLCILGVTKDCVISLYLGVF